MGARPKPYQDILNNKREIKACEIINIINIRTKKGYNMVSRTDTGLPTICLQEQETKLDKRYDHNSLSLG